MPDMAYLKVGDTSYKVKDITAQNGIGDINQAIRDLPQIRDAIATNTRNITQLQTATQDLPDIRQDVEQNANDINDLKSALNADEPVIRSLYFEPNITAGIGYMGSDGTIVQDGNVRHKITDKIRCCAGDVFTYLGVGRHSAYSWVFYNGNTVVSSGQYMNIVTPTTVTIPSGVDGVVFSSYIEGTDTNAVVLSVGYVSVFTDDDKKAIRQSIGALSEDDITDEFVKKDNIHSENLFDKSQIVTGEYLSGGTVVSAAGYGHTKPILLDVGDYITRCPYSSYGGNANHIWVTNAAGQYLSKFNATTLDSNAYMVISVAAPQYVEFNLIMAQDYIDTLMLVKGDEVSDYPSTYIPFANYNAVEENVRLNDAMIQEVKDITMTNPLNGKKICADGDSICYGNGYTGGYAKLIAEANAMEYQNIAVGGGTITAETYSGTTARHWICRTVNNLDADADYVLIEGGVNDASLEVTLGEITNGYTATLDDTTFYGAMETICKILSTKFIGKKRAFVIPHGSTSGMLPNANYYNAVIACCSKWGVPVIDLTKSIPAFNQYRNNATLDSIRTEYTTSGDGWHPTETCYRECYVPVIEACLRAM